jgi:hypothetical protein
MKKLLLLLCLLPGVALAQSTNSANITRVANGFTATAASGSLGFQLNQGAKIGYNADASNTVYTKYDGTDFILAVPTSKGLRFSVNGVDKFVMDSTGTITTGIWSGTLTAPRFAGLNGLLQANGASPVSAISTSAGIASAISDETGSGAMVFGTSATISNATLSVDDLGSAFSLNIVSNSSPALAANATLTLNTHDVSRTLSLFGDLTLAANFSTSGPNALTLTTTGATNVTLPTTGTLATLAGSEAFTNKTLTSPTITNASLTLDDAGSVYTLELRANSSMAMMAPATLTFDTRDASRTIAMSGDLTLAANFTTSGNNALTLTTTGSTNVTLPTSGTLYSALSGGNSLNFGSTDAGTCSDLTINILGALPGAKVVLGLPAAPEAGFVFSAFVSAGGVVTVRACNITSGTVDPAAADYNLLVFN